MTEPVTVKFGEWLPDLPESDNPGALIALNVIPQALSYRSLNSLQTFTDALDGPATGSFWAQDSNSIIFNFAGDELKLYGLASGVAWDDLSGPTAPYDAPDQWEFEKFGETILATNGNDVMQKLEMNVDATFIDQPGTPPVATRMAVVRDFVMLGDIQTGVGAGPSNIQWSGFNNSELWVPSIATQSDFQSLFGRGGRVQKIVPGEYGVIFMEQSIFRADYVGPAPIFQLDEVERKRGTPAPNSVCWSGTDVYYYGWDGFYHFDGSKSTQISANRVALWFEREADGGVLASMRGVVDRLNRLVIWAFKSSGSSAQNDRLIIYNWAADKWSHAEIDTQLIDEYTAPGFTLDELDVPLPGGIDTDSIPVDSDVFKGGNVNLLAFTSANIAATFDGVALAATIDTKEISGPNQNRIFCNGVRPLVEASGGSTITLQVGKRNRLQDNPTFTLAKGVNGINGMVNIRENSRYQRYRLNITGGFLHGNGVKANIREAGKR
jgi:hypothetical protein